MKVGRVAVEQHGKENPGVSRLLCKRPGFVFGMGCRGRVSLPLAIDVVAFHVVIAKLSPRPASVPATES